MEYNGCDFCFKEFKSDRALRIHFGKVHSKAICKDSEHTFDEFDICTKKDCGYRLEWVEVFEEWKDGWATPDVFVKDEDGNRIMLREHTLGETPFVKVENKDLLNSQ